MHRANGSDHSALQLLSTLPPVSSGETLVSYALELLFTSAHDEIVCFACDQSELITDAALEEYTNHFQASPEREVCYLVCCVRDVAVVVHTATGQVLHAVKLTEGEGSHLCLVRRRDAEGGESPSVKHALGDTKGVLLLLSGFEFYPADTSRTGERGVPDRQVRPFVAVLQLTFQLFKLPRTSLETLHEPPAPYVRLTLQDMAWLDFHLRDSTPPLSESSLKERQSALYIFEQMVPTVSVEAGAVAEGGEVGVVVQTPHHKWKGALHISYEPDDAHPSYCPLCHVSLKVEG
ncbi:hypothetical protein AGDE_13577 [Angomonas deanei]|uniref:Uncharacterized protein n=1 Tax=Angomonas deanei TaxID=59799 RepID=A0A7G2CF22_9TRYP|nr:hypothetical protein AGDE_13577 [Angomonas deanei]CAD2218376.1 hypothetical protein, conserved [Angomonas deanei]|eukprot:EPY22151.1 hypothetical protein AGDE_13577 [Angomonas deanei]